MSLRHFVVACLVFCTVALMGGWAVAADTTGCDPQYMDAIEMRGRMEISREHIQNQNYIYKADSVLEYTCFQYEPGRLSGGFTETGETNDTSGSPASIYVNLNFSHTFLGGHMATDPPAATMDSCGIMAAVWQAAHCINFLSRPDQEGWFDFHWYTTNDPRTIPAQACNSPQISAENMRIAFNNKQARYVPTAENPNDAALYKTDIIDAHTDAFGTDCDTSPQIPTGVVVHRDEVDPSDVRDSSIPVDYNEKVCPYPGCYYHPTGMDTGECKNSP